MCATLAWVAVAFSEPSTPLTADTTDRDAATSKLWGQAGELFQPRARLEDFSYAGYHMGEQAIPDVPVWKNLKTDYGARGDGRTDDTNALLWAIRAFPGNAPGALYIPAGTYRLSKMIDIGKSYLVLRGAGRDQTILAFDRGGWRYYLENGGPQPGYASPQMIRVNGSGNLRHHTLDRAPLVGRVVREALRGDRDLYLDRVQNLQAGQWAIMLLWNGPTDQKQPPEADSKGLARYLIAGHDLPRHKPARPPWQDAGLIQWLVRITAVDPVHNKLTLYQPLPWDVKPDQWLGQVRRPEHLRTVEVGIEDLTIDFPANTQPWIHHNRQVRPEDGKTYKDWDDGYNAVQWSCLNCWMRRVGLSDYDSGIFVYGYYNTLQDIVAYNQDRHGRGHYTIRLGGAYNVLDGLTVIGRNDAHGLSLSAEHHNVFSHVRHSDQLSMDLHGGAASYNLFTDIEACDLSEFLGTGDRRAVPHGRGLTYWNVKARNGNYNYGRPIQNQFGEQVEGFGLNIIGVNAPQWHAQTEDPFLRRGQPWREAGVIAVDAPGTYTVSVRPKRIAFKTLMALQSVILRHLGPDNPKLEMNKAPARSGRSWPNAALR